MMQRSRVQRVAIVAFATALALTGCSKNGGSSASGPDGAVWGQSGLTQGEVPSSGDPRPTGTPIKIGVTYSSGAASGDTQKYAAEVGAAWAEWVNTDMGGVNGHPVEVVAEAHDGTGASASSAMRKLVEEDKVVAMDIFGPEGLGAAVEYLPKTGVPLIAGVSSQGNPIDIPDAPPWPNNWFSYDTTVKAYIESANLGAQSSGLKSVLYATCSESAPCAGAGGFLDATAKDYGLSYKGVVTLAAGQASYTPQCLQIKQSGAEAMQVAPFPQAVVGFLTQCLQQGVTAKPQLFSSLIDPGPQKDIPGTMLVQDSAFPWWVNEQPVIDFRAVMAKYSPDTDLRYLSAQNTWQGLELFRKTMGQYGPEADADVTPDDITNAYHQVKNETLDGLLASPISFVKSGPQPAVKCLWLTTYEPSNTDGAMFKSIENTEGTSGNGIEGALSSWCVK